jgi:DNA repair protein RadC
VPLGFNDGSGWAPLQPGQRRHGSDHAVSREEPFPSTGPHGHRRRMRARVLERGAGTLADYEVLEMLLFLTIPLIDTKPIAKAAINRFGSLAAVLNAPTHALMSVNGMAAGCAEVFALVRDSCGCLTQTEVRATPVLSDWASLRAYLVGVAPCALRVLYLDNRNRLLADETSPGKTLDVALGRAVLKRALELHAVSLLLAAWRADPWPAEADRAVLAQFRAAGAVLSVGIHDLVLIAGTEVRSVHQSA